MKKEHNVAIVNHTVLSEDLFVEGAKHVSIREGKQFVFRCARLAFIFCAFSIFYFLVPKSFFALYMGSSFGLTAAVIIIFLIYRRQRLYFRRVYRKLKNGPLSERTYHFTKNAIFSKRLDSEFTLRYEQIEKTYETEHTLVLCTDPSFFLVQYIYIDKNGFIEGSYEDLRERLKIECGAPGE